MATFNGERFIRQQLNSILKQLSEEDEVIISDDGSTDKTIDIIQSFEDHRIRVYYSSGRNLISNFENALNQVTGDYVFLSDQDDIWFENKVERMLAALKNNLLVFSNAQVFYENEHYGDLLLLDSSNPTGFLKNIIKNHYVGATMAFCAELLRAALPFPKNLPMHDMWLGLLAELKGTTGFIKQPLIYYRRHAETASTTGTKSKNSLLRKLGLRLRILYALSLRHYFNA